MESILQKIESLMKDMAVIGERIMPFDSSHELWQYENAEEYQGMIARVESDSQYKRLPSKSKKWMSVPEMGELLGLKKTDRYWLVHKNYFECKEILGQMRINIESFEKWYANQIKYHKVTGEEPGKALKGWSYSVPEVLQFQSQ